jgi:hypothetical protein
MKAFFLAFIPLRYNQYHETKIVRINYCATFAPVLILTLMTKYIIVLVLFSKTIAAQLSWQWTRPLISNYDNNGADIKVESSFKDNSGNIYLGGSFTKTFDFDPGPNTISLSAVSTGMSAFIAKYNANGDLIWAKNFGNNLETHVTGIAVDPSGNVNMTGYYYGIADFDPDPAAASTYTMRAGWYTTSAGCYVNRLNGSGNYIGSFSISGGGDYAYQSTESRGVSILLDNAGALNVIGYYSGTMDFDVSLTTSVTATASGNTLFIGKYFTSGNYLSAISLTGNGNAIPVHAAINSSNEMYVTGYFNYAKDFDPGPGVISYTSSPASNLNSFIAKYDNVLSLMWARPIAGVNAGSSNVATRIALDAAGEPWLAGQMYGTADFDPAMSSFSLNESNSVTGFITRYDNASNFVEAHAFTNHPGQISAKALQFDQNNNMFFIGGSGNAFLDADLTANTHTVMTSGGSFLVQNMYTDARQCSNNGTTYGINPALDAELIVNGSDVYVSQFAYSSAFDFDPGPSSYTMPSTFRGVYLTKYTTSVATAVKQNTANNAVRVYPNPSNGRFLIESPADSEAHIFNLFGKCILSQKLDKGENKIDLSDQASGVYFIRSNNITYKLIKQ